MRRLNVPGMSTCSAHFTLEERNVCIPYIPFVTYANGKVCAECANNFFAYLTAFADWLEPSHAAGLVP